MIGNLKTTPKNCGGIYRIRNTVNDKYYIGSTVCFYNRLKYHRWALNNNKHKNRNIQNDYNKFGNDVFTFEILEIVKDKDELLNSEQKYLDVLDNSYSYNLHVTAGSSKDYVVPKEFVEKTKNTKRKNHSFGSKLSRLDVIEIKKMLKNRSIMQKDIAQKYGVAESVISRIKSGDRWGHIELEGE
jgi:group I intron endonuclease